VAFPDYAISHALCAAANAAASVVQSGVATSDELARLRKLARECADRALAMDPKMANAYFAKAALNDPGLKVSEREHLVRKALEVDPNFQIGMLSYAGLLYGVGRLREARGFIERLINDDPIVPAETWIERAVAAAAVGEILLARDQFRRA